MSKNLVIVESPAKAKTIEGYLGKDFKVTSSFGHVRDLPKGNSAIDLENDYEPTYEVSADKKEVIQKLKKLAEDAEMIYLASDDDREGEAISWHLKEVLDLDDQRTRRIVFTEITKNAIKNALESPRGIDIDLVNAQQARRVLDRLVGFELSPILWKKIKTGTDGTIIRIVGVVEVPKISVDVYNFNKKGQHKKNVVIKSLPDEIILNLSNTIDTTNENGSIGSVIRYGMTLRDYFAAKAMQGFISAKAWHPDFKFTADFNFEAGNIASTSVAISAYKYADAMLKAREQ